MNTLNEINNALGLNLKGRLDHIAELLTKHDDYDACNELDRLRNAVDALAPIEKTFEIKMKVTFGADAIEAMRKNLKTTETHPDCILYDAFVAELKHAGGANIHGTALEVT